ncbi:MAG: hypothetical protein PW845_18650 [Pseudomonas sp.]|nr:hypothetical protein [Pseudomonas sp. PIA16]MDE1167335.1 hypothetical protein [Pseudomonas sp.]
MKAPTVRSIAGSALALSAGKRLLLAVAVLALLWLAITWAVAVP